MSRLQPTYKPAKPIVSVLYTTKRVPVMSSQQIKNHVTCSTVYKREEINLTVRTCSLTCSPAWNVCLSHLWKYWMQEDIRSGDNNSKRNPDYEHFNSFRLVSFSHSIQFWHKFSLLLNQASMKLFRISWLTYIIYCILWVQGRQPLHLGKESRRMKFPFFTVENEPKSFFAVYA